MRSTHRRDLTAGLVAGLLIYSLTNQVVAQPPVRSYLAGDDHTDYFWTADAATYDRTFVDMLDFHLDLID